MTPAAAPDELAVTLSAASRFALLGRIVSCERYGNGHINDTYLLHVDQHGSPVRWILQRINGRVFPQPRQVMENIAAVLAAARRGDDARTVLDLLPARDGRPWVEDAAGALWRCYPFVEGSRTIERVAQLGHAQAAARAFARFLASLDGWSGPRLHEVIPGFHDTPRRLARLRASAQADVCGRLAEVRAQVDWALSHDRLAGALLAARDAGEVPERITHNDTKINNVLFHADRDEGLCVIDLDTLMPGLSLYDFGDLVRTATATAAEDERDLSLVDSDPRLYAAVEDGWLSELSGVLTPAERRLLPLAGMVITFECGVRFLTDHLDGDRYFRITRPGHNRDRAVTQFRMVESMMRRME